MKVDQKVDLQLPCCQNEDQFDQSSQNGKMAKNVKISDFVKMAKNQPKWQKHDRNDQAYMFYRITR